MTEFELKIIEANILDIHVAIDAQLAKYKALLRGLPDSVISDRGDELRRVRKTLTNFSEGVLDDLSPFSRARGLGVVK